MRHAIYAPAAALLAVLVLTPGAIARPPTPSLRRLEVAEGGKARLAGSQRYAPLRKLDYGLQDALATRLGHPPPSRGGLRVVPVPVSPSGRVLVDVYANGGVQASTEALRGAGMRVNAVSRRSPLRIVEGWVPVGDL